MLNIKFLLSVWAIFELIFRYGMMKEMNLLMNKGDKE